MYLSPAGIEREELLEMLVKDYIYALSTYNPTLLGQPREITYAEGRLSGACTVLGLEWVVVKEEIIFSTFIKEKEILRLPFKPDKPW